MRSTEKYRNKINLLLTDTIFMCNYKVECFEINSLTLWPYDLCYPLIQSPCYYSNLKNTFHQSFSLPGFKP